MKITKERFRDLGLGLSKESCKCCESCDIDKDGDLICIDGLIPMNIEKAEQAFRYASCLDEQRLQEEMTEEEYDAFRHGRLEVVEDESDEEICKVDDHVVLIPKKAENAYGKIAVGDVVRFRNTKYYYLVTSVVTLYCHCLRPNGSSEFNDMKYLEKTGRTIDIASVLEQIGG